VAFTLVRGERLKPNPRSRRTRRPRNGACFRGAGANAGNTGELPPLGLRPRL
jgi:hypothetical protein